MNVGLDLVGQARNWLDYAAELLDDGRDADALAFRRDERAYRNLLLVEQPNGDYAVTMLKQFLYDAWHHAVLKADGLQRRTHRRHRRQGPERSHLPPAPLRRMGATPGWRHQSQPRMLAAIPALWRFTVGPRQRRRSPWPAGIAADPRSRHTG
jgi:ring-1,2-phenylacetyl-CoA epoxidase subunit PaaC